MCASCSCGLWFVASFGLSGLFSSEIECVASEIYAIFSLKLRFFITIRTNFEYSLGVLGIRWC